MRCVMNQVAAVEEWHDLHAFGQNALVQLLHFGVNAIQRAVGLRALLEKHDSLDHVVVADYRAVFAPDGFANLPEANLGALRHRGDLLDAERCTWRWLHYILFELLGAYR